MTDDTPKYYVDKKTYIEMILKHSLEFIKFFNIDFKRDTIEETNNKPKTKNEIFIDNDNINKK